MKHSILGGLLFIIQFMNVPISAQPPAYADILLEGEKEVASLEDTKLQLIDNCTL